MEVTGFDQLWNEVASLTIVPPDGIDVSTEDWTNVIFDNSWGAVTSVKIEGQSVSSQISYPVIYNPSIDNFSASVVPVPAAVWLFGSALAGLGWLKRKQSI
jgi:hypothetical protein